jgi:hypothetical protein
MLMQVERREAAGRGRSVNEKHHGFWCKMKQKLHKLAYGEIGTAPIPHDERKIPTSGDARYDKTSQPVPLTLAQTRMYRTATTAPPSAETSPQLTAQREVRPRSESEQDRYDASIFPPTPHSQDTPFEPAPANRQHSLAEVAAHQRRAPVHHVHGSRI